ncbi:hypothetical protein PR202_gb08791 [Eleusine coracana subsp. coracana]|uniref:ZP domain-containing protein n=1 Tax=Eleusine coracana subsp. coracana TaxID=191504 RepID=A0AAV5EGH1_ELECO|nr:hypothetical protein PR202_gb08791 [Eleusine coracana subsp. coracana]
MACPAQSMLSASGCIFLSSSKPQATLVRGSLAVAGGISSSGRQFLLTCNASSSPSPSSPPPPAPPQEDADCNEEECAPEKEVGSLSAEWLAEREDPGGGHLPAQEEGVDWTYREGHRRPDQHLLCRADGVRGGERPQLRRGGLVVGGGREHGGHRGRAGPHHRRRGLVHPHPGEQEPAAGAGSRLQRPAAQLLRRQVPAPAGGGGPRPRRAGRGPCTGDGAHRGGLCPGDGLARRGAAVLVSRASLDLEIQFCGSLQFTVTDELVEHADGSISDVYQFRIYTQCMHSAPAYDEYETSPDSHTNVIFMTLRTNIELQEGISGFWTRCAMLRTSL